MSQTGLQTEIPSESETLSKKDFDGRVNPDWCPGCGDFGVLNALKTALAELNLRPHQVVTVSGIGCSSNLPGYLNTYGMHTLHGRSLPVATGVQLANHELKVVVTGGDGDGYGIGGNHMVHAMRRNLDLLYIVMDNQIYGLTTGQTSPTSVQGMKTKSTPNGNLDHPINPIPLAIISGATYVARGFSANQAQLVELIKGGLQHRGFALIDVFSPCVTYNHDNTFQWFRPRVKPVSELGHDPQDLHAAIDRGLQWGEEIPTGLIYQRQDRLPLHAQEPALQNGPLAFQEPRLEADKWQQLVAEFT